MDVFSLIPSVDVRNYLKRKDALLPAETVLQLLVCSEMPLKRKIEEMTAFADEMRDDAVQKRVREWIRAQKDLLDDFFREDERAAYGWLSGQLRNGASYGDTEVFATFKACYEAAEKQIPGGLGAFWRYGITKCNLNSGDQTEVTFLPRGEILSVSRNGEKPHYAAPPELLCPFAEGDILTPVGEQPFAGEPHLFLEQKDGVCRCIRFAADNLWENSFPVFCAEYFRGKEADCIVTRCVSDFLQGRTELTEFLKKYPLRLMQNRAKAFLR